MKRKLVTLMLSTSVAIAGVIAPANSFAAPTGIAHESEYGNYSEEQLANLLEEIDQAETQEEAEQAFYTFFSTEEVQQLEQEYATPSRQLIEGNDTTFRSRQDFLSCMKGKATDDIKGLFDISAISIALGNKDYQKAAKEILEHLGKQGIKRNLAGLVALLGMWGWQCRDAW